jgi:hypothetical protein
MIKKNQTSLNYVDDKDEELEKQQEETGEITSAATTNHIF